MVLSAFFLLVALASSFLARADVVPSEPSPGAVFNEGQPCTLSWNADTGGSGAWKSMSIELMTGDNFNMIQLMSVGTTFDGTVNGQFSYTCPDVTVNSAIYFYQFTSPQSTDKAWTTRFAIAGPNGETTPPANAVQPNSGDKIPWGVGALVGGSSAAPAPTGATNSSSSVSVGSPAPPATQSSAPVPVVTPVNTVDSPPTLATTKLGTTASATDQSSPSGVASNTGNQTDASVRTTTASLSMSLILPAFALLFF